MASGAAVDRIASEFGIHFVSSAKRAEGRHQSKARKTCLALLKKHGAEHLRLVFGLINTPANRGNWSAPVLSAVSWVIVNQPGTVARRDFVTSFDRLDLGALHARAKNINPEALTITLAVLLSYELDQSVQAGISEEAA
ncbi:hypothetical protein ABVF61_05510 [Roseibium sp. HPY-6]|uniref:hypothetical protein n=1 Tax=Roseibium sp. HPY-6 TaxID=3229852 RepID=UPI00338EB622